MAGESFPTLSRADAKQRHYDPVHPGTSTFHSDLVCPPLPLLGPFQMGDPGKTAPCLPSSGEPCIGAELKLDWPDLVDSSAPLETLRYHGDRHGIRTRIEQEKPPCTDPPDTLIIIYGQIPYEADSSCTALEYLS